jgi:hypothetical protein
MEEALPGCHSGGFILRGSALQRRSEVKATGARLRGSERTRNAHRLWIGLFSAPVLLIPNYDQYKKPEDSDSFIPSERIHVNSPSAS